VTYGLIAANVMMFAFEVAQTESLGGPSSQQMIALGGNFGPLTRNGEAWRLVTAMFLHYGVIHVGMNMVCLYQIGVVERMLGRAEFLALYFAAGLVGGLASVATHPHAVSAGASGAVFGMFGAFTAVMVVRRSQIDPGAWQRTMRSLGAFFAINLMFGLTQRSIDLSAHFGGLAVGFVGAFVLAKTASPSARSMWRALAVALAGLGTAFGGLYALPR
jgi:rhomboid protease GluP